MEQLFLQFYIMRRAKKRQILSRRRRLHQLRTENDPFESTEEVFQKNYRLPKNLCRALISELEPFDTQQTTLPFKTRFLLALNFFANGSDQQCIGNSFGTAMSQSMVSRSIYDISKLIIQRKGHEVRFPENDSERSAIKIGFHRDFQIQGTIGPIDCTHVAIITPSSADRQNPQKLYMNRKGFYSINVEAICDHRMLFTSINAQYPGSCHDSGIWTLSPARRLLASSYRSDQANWLLGDQVYPLEPWLLTPYASPTTDAQRTFNSIHIRARNVIERAFGVLKGRFRCISKMRVLNYSHERAANIIYACAILHNILLKNGVQLPQSEEESMCNIKSGEEENPNEDSVHSRLHHHREGIRRREAYVSSL